MAPSYCVVPLCSNRASGHRFPKKTRLFKAWMTAIKRDKFVPTEHSRVCNKHFTPSDYVLPKDSVTENPKPRLKKGTVPSVFAWTKGKSPVDSQRAERAKKRLHFKKHLKIETPGEDTVVQEPDVYHIDIELEQSGSGDEPGSCLPVQEDFEMLGDLSVVHEEIVRDSLQCEGQDSMFIQEEGGGQDGSVIHEEGDSTKSNYIEEEIKENTSQQPCSHAMRIVDYKGEGKSSELKFYTGFDSYEHFMFVFHLLGPASYHLKYYSEYSVHGGRDVKNLLPEDQFFF